MTDPTDLTRLDARALAAAYRHGAVSPVDVAEAVLARMEATHADLNAVIALDAAQVRRDALASASRWRRAAPLSGLDGVPLTVKDNIPVAGLPCTWGSVRYRDWRPVLDELPVARLRAAGAVIVGKTNVPAFTLQGHGCNTLHGCTRNPWAPGLTTGGSSAGAVAAVASGIGPLALATDGGGSIRRPAGFAGLVGLKPTAGRVPRCDGLPPILLDFEVIGPIARTVGDVVATMAIIGHADPRDLRSRPWSRWPFDARAAARAPRRLRVLRVDRIAGAPVDAGILDSLDRFAQRLQAQGHVVNAAQDFDAPQAVNDVAWPAISQAGLAWLMDHHAQGPATLDAGLSAMADAGRALSAPALMAAFAAIAQCREQLAAVFAQHDLILTPSSAAMPWPLAHTHPTSIDGQPVGPRGHAVFTAFVNAAGLPALALPAPSDGLPIGVQLVGRAGDDELLCSVAATYEAAWPWRERWPPAAGA